MKLNNQDYSYIIYVDWQVLNYPDDRELWTLESTQYWFLLNLVSQQSLAILRNSKTTQGTADIRLPVLLMNKQKFRLGPNGIQCFNLN